MRGPTKFKRNQLDTVFTTMLQRVAVACTKTGPLCADCPNDKRIWQDFERRIPAALVENDGTQEDEQAAGTEREKAVSSNLELT